MLGLTRGKGRIYLRAAVGAAEGRTWGQTGTVGMGRASGRSNNSTVTKEEPEQRCAAKEHGQHGAVAALARAFRWRLAGGALRRWRRCPRQPRAVRKRGLSCPGDGR